MQVNIKLHKKMQNSHKMATKWDKMTTKRTQQQQQQQSGVKTCTEIQKIIKRLEMQTTIKSQHKAVTKWHETIRKREGQKTDYRDSKQLSITNLCEPSGNTLVWITLRVLTPTLHSGMLGTWLNQTLRKFEADDLQTLPRRKAPTQEWKTRTRHI